MKIFYTQKFQLQNWAIKKYGWVFSFKQNLFNQNLRTGNSSKLNLDCRQESLESYLNLGLEVHLQAILIPNETEVCTVIKFLTEPKLNNWLQPR